MVPPCQRTERLTKAAAILARIPKRQNPCQAASSLCPQKGQRIASSNPKEASTARRK